MGMSFDYLGYYNTIDKKLLTIKGNVLRGNYKRPIDYKKTEELFPDWVFVWGVEDSNELFQKIISRSSEQERLMVGLLIYSTMNTNCKNEVRGCFSLLKKHDIELYNQFGDDILKDMRLSSSKWWKFW